MNQNQDGLINRREFDKYLKRCGIGSDKMVADRLFYVFDTNGTLELDITEMIVTIGGIPTTPFATPGTSELGESIREVVRCSDTLVMRNHGSVCVGTSLLDAFKKLDMLEHTARILWLAHTAKGGLDPLPPEAVKKLLDTRSMLGLDNRNTLENRCGLPGE